MKLAQSFMVSKKTLSVLYLWANSHSIHLFVQIRSDISDPRSDTRFNRTFNAFYSAIWHNYVQIFRLVTKNSNIDSQDTYTLEGRGGEEGGEGGGGEGEGEGEGGEGGKLAEERVIQGALRKG